MSSLEKCQRWFFVPLRIEGTWSASPKHGKIQLGFGKSLCISIANHHKWLVDMNPHLRLNSVRYRVTEISRRGTSGLAILDPSGATVLLFFPFENNPRKMRTDSQKETLFTTLSDRRASAEPPQSLASSHRTSLRWYGPLATSLAGVLPPRSGRGCHCQNKARVCVCDCLPPRGLHTQCFLRSGLATWIERPQVPFTMDISWTEVAPRDKQTGLFFWPLKSSPKGTWMFDPPS